MGDALTVKRGSLFPQGQRTVVKFDPQTGITVKNAFNGAGQAEMQALFLDMIRAGIASEITYENDKASLETSDSTEQTTLDTWQILGNVESVDGLSHPTLLDLLNDASIARLRKALSENLPPSEIGFSSGGFSDSEKAIINRFYTLQQRGSTDYRRAEYVLRHTTNAPNGYSVNIADIGVNMIYSPAKLLSEIQNSSLWTLPCPPRLAFKIANIPAIVPPDPSEGVNYFWGWLKSPSTETTAANNRIDISTEYTLELWSTDYYEVY